MVVEGVRQASNSNVNGVYVYYRSGEHASTQGSNGAANLRGTTAARQDRRFVPGIRYPAGVYVGERVAPVPKNVAEKIWRWDFVEMSELLQEFWELAGERGYAEKDKSGSRYFYLGAMLHIICECVEWAVPRSSTRLDGLHGHDCQGKPVF